MVTSDMVAWGEDLEWWKSCRAGVSRWQLRAFGLHSMYQICWGDYWVGEDLLLFMRNGAKGMRTPFRSVGAWRTISGVVAESFLVSSPSAHP
jgi:hypothetical protein